MAPKKEQNEEQEHEDSERMMNQAWLGLSRIGQPVVVGVLSGKLIIELNKSYTGNYHGLLIPALAWPLVGLSIASSVNVGVKSVDLSVRNYIYYSLIGCLASSATISAIYTQFFFEQLNDGILKGVFTGTLVSEDKKGFAAGLVLGLNVMVAFHSLYSAFQRHIYNLAFKTGKKD